MTRALSLLALLALVSSPVLLACSASQSPTPVDASADGAGAPFDSGLLTDGGADAPGGPTSGITTIIVNGVDNDVSGDYLTGYGAMSVFNESADNAELNVELEWSGAGVGTYPCTYALVYVFAAQQLTCDYQLDTSTDAGPSGTCSVTITSDGPNEGDPVVATFTGSLPPNPNAHNVKSCSDPGMLSGTFTQPRPTSADAGTP